MFIGTLVKRIIAAVAIMSIVALVICTVYQNNIVETECFTSYSDRLPKEFDGFKIAHISDLHCEEMGEENYKIIDILKEQTPDIIVITGDIIDINAHDREVMLDLVKEALKIAQCYYVTGNREGGIPFYGEIKTELAALGVAVLSNYAVDIEYNGAVISIAGIDDPMYTIEQEVFDYSVTNEEIVKKNLSKIEFTDRYTILLSHRPDYLSEFEALGVDLVLSGHYHGGYFRLPFIGGVVGRDDGAFPKYSGGQYKEGNTDMIVSCGIATSDFWFRFNNPPEVGIIELRVK